MITPKQARALSSSYPSQAQIDEELERMDRKVRNAAENGHHSVLVMYALLPATVSALRAGGYTVTECPRTKEGLSDMCNISWGRAI